MPYNVLIQNRLNSLAQQLFNYTSLNNEHVFSKYNNSLFIKLHKSLCL